MKQRFVLALTLLCALVLGFFRTSVRANPANTMLRPMPSVLLSFFDIKCQKFTFLAQTADGVALVWKGHLVTDLAITSTGATLNFLGMFEGGVPRLFGLVQPSGNGNWTVVINDLQEGGHDFSLNSEGVMLDVGRCLCPSITGSICIAQDCTDGNPCTLPPNEQICKRYKPTGLVPVPQK